VIDEEGKALGVTRNGSGHGALPLARTSISRLMGGTPAEAWE